MKAAFAMKDEREKFPPRDCLCRKSAKFSGFPGFMFADTCSGTITGRQSLTLLPNPSPVLHLFFRFFFDKLLEGWPIYIPFSISHIFVDKNVFVNKADWSIKQIHHATLHADKGDCCEMNLHPMAWLGRAEEGRKAKISHSHPRFPTLIKSRLGSTRLELFITFINNCVTSPIQVLDCVENRVVELLLLWIQIYRKFFSTSINIKSSLWKAKRTLGDARRRKWSCFTQMRYI